MVHLFVKEKAELQVRGMRRQQNTYLQAPPDMILSIGPGDVAQLGERDNRTVEVRGSSPLISTYQCVSQLV